MAVPTQAQTKLQHQITSSKNETPPLKRKRNKAEENEIMTKLSSAFDSFNAYLKTKTDINETSAYTTETLQHESTINFLKSVGNDLLQIKNKKIRYKTEIEIMQSVKNAVCEDMEYD